MAGIGDRMSGANSIVRRADGTIRDDVPGSPPPDPETMLRLEHMWEMWSEDVPFDDVFLPEDVADWPPEWRRRLDEARGGAV